MTKAPIPEMSISQRDNTKRNRKDYTAIADRFMTVNYSHQLVWLTGLRVQPSHSPQQPCNQNYTHLRICK